MICSGGSTTASNMLATVSLSSGLVVCRLSFRCLESGERVASSPWKGLQLLSMGCLPAEAGEMAATQTERAPVSGIEAAVQ